jgi:hypothetical protein
MEQFELVSQANVTPIWFNSLLKIKKEVLYWQEFSIKGVNCFRDVTNDETEMLTDNEACNMYGELPILQYNALAVMYAEYKRKTVYQGKAIPLTSEQMQKPHRSHFFMIY